MEVGGTRYREVKEEELEGRRGIDTYPALLLSSSQPLDWPVLGWALLSHWGRATQNHTPKERGGRKKWMEEEKRRKQGKKGSRQRRINRKDR